MSAVPPTPTDPRAWRPALGALPRPDGSTRFAVWAPLAQSVAVRLPGAPQRGDIPLVRGEGGVYAAEVPDMPPGSDYLYVLDGQRALPDPASQHQPHGVHGPSRVVDHRAFAWRDAHWRGRPLTDYVTCELHVGTFTPEGTFDAAAGRLEHLRDAGFTAVELMPVAAFPGTRNWGYDGAYPYAPQESYGGPEGLKRLVAACHQAGLAVVLDVVYNHLGPEGSYLHAYGPYFTDRYRTPWGDALNFDGADSDAVRRFFVENALHWLTAYRIDALRLDAVHGIFDFSAQHILAELGEAFHRQAARLGRQAWLIAESDLNDTRVIDPPRRGGWGMDAQWNDDFHHAFQAVAAGSTRGYFADFGAVDDLAGALTRGYVYDGRHSRYRRRRHGNSSATQPGWRFAAFTQNHDQIANAQQGMRQSALGPPAQEKLALALVFCAPYLPLLFMGQEYGEVAPFLYFTSHSDPALAEAVTAGRREEHRAFGDAGVFADPQAEETFRRSRLDWTLPRREPHAGILRFVRELAGLRRTHAALGNCDKARTRCVIRDAADGRWLVLLRGDARPGGAMLFCNLSAQAAALPAPHQGVSWRLALWSGDAAYGGDAAAGAEADAGPPADLAAGPHERARVPLGGWHVALYLRRTA